MSDYQKQVESMTDGDLARHALIGKMCLQDNRDEHCGCFCCHARRERTRRDVLGRKAK